MEAIKRLDFPLIVIPQEAKFSRICKIGLACDMKDVIETVPIHEIRNIVNEFHAELHVLHVSPESVGEFDTEKKEESSDLQQMLLSMNPRYDFIKGIDVEEEIIQFAEKNKLDLLIVIPKYDNLLYKIFQKSNSDRIVLHAHIPVLTIHE